MKATLFSEHPPEYMDIVAIADPRPANRDRTFKGSHPEVRIGLNKKLGMEKAAKIQQFESHIDLLKARRRKAQWNLTWQSLLCR